MKVSLIFALALSGLLTACQHAPKGPRPPLRVSMVRGAPFTSVELRAVARLVSALNLPDERTHEKIVPEGGDEEFLARENYDVLKRKIRTALGDTTKPLNVWLTAEDRDRFYRLDRRTMQLTELKFQPFTFQWHFSVDRSPSGSAINIEAGSLDIGLFCFSVPPHGKIDYLGMSVIN